MLKRSQNISSIWEDCFLFLNPINNYIEFKEVLDLPVVSQLIGGIVSIYLTLKSVIAICFFAPFMGVNMLLKP